MVNRHRTLSQALLVGSLLVTFLTSSPGLAKPKPAAAPVAATTVDPTLFQGLEWRFVGPWRGGRVTAVAGVASQPMTFYFGSTGGGVWKTEDGGNSWANVSDGFFKTGSVGAIAVAPSDPNVVYVGMGEAPVRGVTTSHGDGVYRSTDAGKTWARLGLEATRQISRLQVHPSDPDLVYVAAQGSPFAAGAERGIYRSRDGGKSWQKVLFVSADAGAADLAMDASNPRILYAAFWDHRRTPWEIRSGGPGSSIHKSVDGGETWEKLTGGLPAVMGKIGVAVSPAKPQRVWAMVEADDGGLYRSDDGGKSWDRVNSERLLRGRAWYYTHVIADPQDADTVYVLNAPMLRSIDGGKTFTTVRTPHGDNHALWINPKNAAWMINGNDGGANVSFNGGDSWSTQANQPTAQFYRVAVDNRDPYWLYGGQQDNTSVAIASRGLDGSIGREDWEAVGGCESAHVAFDPDRPMRIYAGCYQGEVSEYDRETGLVRDIRAYPETGLASVPVDRKYRFNWNAPLVVSPQDPRVLYHGAQKLLRSTDRGLSWQEISPDLTGNDPAKLGPGGRPFTREGAGGEVYQTIFAVVPSPHAAGTLWVGTDDGHLQLTRDDGGHWQEITPPGLGEAQINAIEVSPHDAGRAWIAVTRYKFDDFAPQIWATRDFGLTWRKTVAGLPADAWVRVVREDRQRRGLLFAGTETGLYVSFDDGDHWQAFQGNLPVVPVTDLAVHGDDLVAATQGRGFWVLDNLSPLRGRQLGETVAAPSLAPPVPAVLRYYGDHGGGPAADNPADGAVLDYFLPATAGPSSAAEPAKPAAHEGGDEAAKAPELKIEVLDGAGQVLRTLSSKPQGDAAGGAPQGPGGRRRSRPLPTKAGHNRTVWDLRPEPFTKVPGLRLADRNQPPLVSPGTYQLRLTYGDAAPATQPLEVRLDPRLPPPDPAVEAERRELVAWAAQALDELYRSVNRLRSARDQVSAVLARAREQAGTEELKQAGDRLLAAEKELEETLVQTKSETFQDIINFPNQLDSELATLASALDLPGVPVTAGARQRAADLRERWQERQGAIADLLERQLGELNALAARLAVPAVVLPSGTDGPTQGERGKGLGKGRSGDENESGGRKEDAG